MPNYPFIPEGLFPIKAIAPVDASTAAMVGDYISLKNVQMAWVVVFLDQTTAHPLVLSIERATDVTPTGSVVIANNVPIWYGNVSATSSLLERQTDALHFDIPALVTGATITIFQIDPASLGDTYDCITIKVSQDGHAGNICAALYFVQPRYQGEPDHRDADEFITD